MKQLATNNPIYTQMTTFVGLQKLSDIVNSAAKKAAKAKTQEK